ncbi:MAG: hypothetical protein ACFFBE_09240 [Promethearchaeota archaeon]
MEIRRYFYLSIPISFETRTKFENAQASIYFSSSENLYLLKIPPTRANTPPINGAIKANPGYSVRKIKFRIYRNS